MWKNLNPDLWSLAIVVLAAFACSQVQPLTIVNRPTTESPVALDSQDAVGQLEGEAGYRMATLQWKFPANQEETTPEAFRVKYCERHAWGLHRCRYQIVDSHGNASHRAARRRDKEQFLSKTLMEKNGVYKIDIGGLRMATNYSFEIMPQLHEWDNHVDGGSAQISLQTKGFSAKASSCLADSSVVVVETGPFFGGRISAENSQSPACALKGDAQSPATQYTLKIKHDECGSAVNASKVTTVILVQENLPILTHSTRRFVVVCTFSPESFIVKAGVNLPRGSSSVGKSMDFSRLIRVSSQNSNILVAKKEEAGYASRNRNSSVVEDGSDGEQTREKEAEASQLQDLGNEGMSESNQAAEESSIGDAGATASIEASSEDVPVQSISGLQEFRQRQSRAYLHSSELNNNQLPTHEGKRPQSLVEARSGRNGQNEGTVEGYIVFGMVVIVIVSGLASVLWFIKSSYKTGTMVGVEQHGDDTSSISGSSSGRTSQLSSVCNSFQAVRPNDGESSLESQQNSLTGLDQHSHSHRAPHNLDTRSELEVELDFEFSEEIHPQSAGANAAGNWNCNDVGKNSFCSSVPKRFTLELDESCQQLSSASHV